MKQMQAPQANVIKTMEVERLTEGFVRDGHGRIFYIRQVNGCPVRHVVLENKTIVMRTSDFPSPAEEIVLINHKDCGIIKIVFAPEGTTVTA